MKDFLPCKNCQNGRDIYIKKVMATRREDLYIVECDVCGMYIPFKVPPWQEPYKTSVEAWNDFQKKCEPTYTGKADQPG